MIQQTLLRDDTKTKTLLTVNRDKLVVSPYNPRRTRSRADIEKLAQRIERNGFEITRALWAYPVNAHYEVFAGGNRLEAVRMTSIEDVPVIVHEGFTDDEITGLADQDNENDEYHTPVSIVDKWMDYKRLADAGWEPSRIEKAKKTTLSRVSERLKYANLPQGVLSAFSKSDFLTESHAAEICRISNLEIPTKWLTRESAMLEVLTKVIAETKTPTAADFKAKVATYNAFIEYAVTVHEKLDTVTLYFEDGRPYEWNAKAAFVLELQKNSARSVQAVKRSEATVRQFISDNLNAYQALLAKRAAEAEQATQAAQTPVTFPYRLIVASADNVPQIESDSIDIIVTSPPYNLGADNWPMGGGGRKSRNGIGYAAHGDTMDQDEYEQWQVSVLREMYRVAKPGASFFYNHKVRTMDGRMIHPLRWLMHADNPWTLRQEIIWNRKSTHNHSAQLFWPIDERIYWMTKGIPVLRAESIGVPTIWEEFGPVPNTWHPAPFTEKLPAMLLEAIGVDGVTVVLDPFAGSCTTVRVAVAMGCNAIGVDVSREYLERAVNENGWSHACID